MYNVGWVERSETHLMLMPLMPCLVGLASLHPHIPGILFFGKSLTDACFGGTEILHET